MKYMQFLTLLLLMLVSGVFWGTWFTLTRSLHTFSTEEFIHIGKVIIANVAAPMRIIFPSCIVFMALSLWWYPSKKSTGFYFGIISLALLLITLLITLLVLVPIDNQIKTWTVSTVPANIASLRNTWEQYHAFRTLTSITSFASFVIAVLKAGDVTPTH